MKMGAFKEEIESMNKFRYSLIEKVNNETATQEDENKIDKLAESIEKYIQLYFEYLPFEFIMEQLSNLGQAPNLLYDDNGHWAVTSTGFQSVPNKDDPEDVETHFFIEAKEWKDTPREALKYYLDN